MPTFQHPSVRNGQITHDGASYPIVEGVVDLPEDLAREMHGLVLVSALPVAAREAAVDPVDLRPRSKGKK